ncbi:MAG: ABC transporter ATP-binding protein [Lachnospiraceae bacterium]|nr:ABC transporter ATP-binding protein [Lachnospiraceae bacterium]
MKILRQINGIYTQFYEIFTPEQRRGSIVVFALMFIGSFLEMLGVSVLVPMVGVILSPVELLHDPDKQWIWECLHIDSTTELVMLISGGTMAIYVFKNIYMSFLSYYKNRFFRKVDQETSMRLMNSYLSRDYTFHINTNSTVLLRSIIYDITGISSTLTSVFTIIMECMSTLMIIIVLFVTDCMMAVTLGISAAFALVIIIAVFHKNMRRQGQNSLGYHQRCIKAVNEAFNGIKDVLVTGRQTYFAQSYEEAVTGKNRANAIKNFASECPAYVIEGICIVTFIAMLCIKSLTGQNGTEFVSNAAAFAMAAFRILPSVGKITNNYNIIVYYRATMNDVYKNICEVQEASEKTGMGQQPALADREKQAHKFQQEICLKQVSWKYPNTEKYIIKDLDMTITKGQAVGFIGASGAGKTTLADMILGLLPTQTGAIYMDDIDIREIPGTWSHTIGYVPQSVYLTDDTIRNNVAFGIDQKEINEENVWEALEQAQLKKFVETLPDGLDTIVGERGVKFSGGQRQRVAIARALYYDPDIIVLDEATSALDNETESAVMEAIESLQGHKTLIIVAHRLTTIKSCDAVYEIADGKAVLQKNREAGHA